MSSNKCNNYRNTYSMSSFLYTQILALDSYIIPENDNNIKNDKYEIFEF